MNANELADELEDLGKFFEDRLYTKAATMLRQQQAQIEALKVRLNPYQSITDTKIEPTIVSYTHPVTEHFEDEPQGEELHEILQSNVELTDEEILAISNENYIENKGGDIEFARAILRKAWD